MKPPTIRVRLDEQGHLVLPPELMERFGFTDGAAVRVEERGDAITFGRTSASLARVYLEPTTVCNLHCRTCIRNVWDEAPGMMSRETFARIIDGVRDVSPLPTLFFGGFGEPFAHPDLLAMLARRSRSGARSSSSRMERGWMRTPATSSSGSGSTDCGSRSTGQRPRATPTSACGMPCRR